MPFRIAFMGTPDFSVPALAALIEAGHDVACVYTQPPRPAHRGQKLQPSPVHRHAEERGLPVRTPKTLRAADAQAEFAALGLDLAVVVAYGLILPQLILDAPRLGCVNIHASLLPRWRGAAPIQRAILAGDAETGVTIMQMDAGLDTGPMLLRERVAIGPDATGGALHDALSAMGARLIVEALRRMEAGDLTATPQPDEGATYAAKIDKAETRIDWREDAASVLRRIRAFAPAPGAWTETADGERVRILDAMATDLRDSGGATPGETLDDRLTVACGQGAIRVLKLQRAGKAAMDADAALRGWTVPRGARFA